MVFGLINIYQITEFVTSTNKSSKFDFKVEFSARTGHDLFIDWELTVGSMERCTGDDD